MRIKKQYYLSSDGGKSVNPKHRYSKLGNARKALIKLISREPNLELFEHETRTGQGGYSRKLIS